MHPAANIEATATIHANVAASASTAMELSLIVSIVNLALVGNPDRRLARK
jgi:hypothetical protein